MVFISVCRASVIVSIKSLISVSALRFLAGRLASVLVAPLVDGVGLLADATGFISLLVPLLLADGGLSSCDCERATD